MKTVYECEKCGRVFDDYEEASKHESLHYSVKTWCDDEDEKVIVRETEYIANMFIPSAVVVPMRRSIYDDDEQAWKTETIYVKYYYAKQQAEQVFPIDVSVIK